MPDHKETGREPTPREREIAFEPHHSPEQQPDGDPGQKRPGIEHDDAGNADENESGEAAGERGKWKDGLTRDTVVA